MNEQNVMLEEWGPKCEDYEPGCACCAAWLLFEAHDVVPSFEEVMSAIGIPL